MDLDLNLWKDKVLIQRQNRLKTKFWSIFSEVGNRISESDQLINFSESKGIKLSRGNDLVGFPYHVLDVIRNWKKDSGQNIRVLNWFGHGIFIFIYLGGERISDHLNKSLEKQHFTKSDQSDPFDYPSIILGSNDDNQIENQENLFVWYKEIEIGNQKEEVEEEIFSQVNGLLQILANP